MPLIKTIDLPHGLGQHFFFDIGNGDSLAFFWFPGAPTDHPGVSSPEAIPTDASMISAYGSLNHIAFNVPPEMSDASCRRLVEKGVKLSPVLNHDDSPMQVSAVLTEAVFVRSIYFFDPDGVCLEFACWAGAFRASDVAHDPMTAGGVKALGLLTAHGVQGRGVRHSVPR